MLNPIKEAKFKSFRSIKDALKHGWYISNKEFCIGKYLRGTKYFVVFYLKPRDAYDDSLMVMEISFKTIKKILKKSNKITECFLSCSSSYCVPPRPVLLSLNKKPYKIITSNTLFYYK